MSDDLFTDPRGTVPAEATDERAAPKRLRAADVIAQLQHTIDALTARGTEPTVSVEITDAAKGEVRVVTKVSAPMGCDLDALSDHADEVVNIAQAIHSENAARKGPDA